MFMICGIVQGDVDGLDTAMAFGFEYPQCKLCRTARSQTPVAADNAMEQRRCFSKEEVRGRTNRMRSSVLGNGSTSTPVAGYPAEH